MTCMCRKEPIHIRIDTSLEDVQMCINAKIQICLANITPVFLAKVHNKEKHHEREKEK